MITPGVSCPVWVLHGGVEDPQRLWRILTWLNHSGVKFPGFAKLDAWLLTKIARPCACSQIGASSNSWVPLHFELQSLVTCNRPTKARRWAPRSFFSENRFSSTLRGRNMAQFAQNGHLGCVQKWGSHSLVGSVVCPLETGKQYRTRSFHIDCTSKTVLQEWVKWWQGRSWGSGLHSHDWSSSNSPRILSPRCGQRPHAA